MVFELAKMPSESRVYYQRQNNEVFIWFTFIMIGQEIMAMINQEVTMEDKQLIL